MLAEVEDEAERQMEVERRKGAEISIVGTYILMCMRGSVQIYDLETGDLLCRNVYHKMPSKRTFYTRF